MAITLGSGSFCVRYSLDIVKILSVEPSKEKEEEVTEDPFSVVQENDEERTTTEKIKQIPRHHPHEQNPGSGQDPGRRNKTQDIKQSIKIVILLDTLWM